MINDLTAIIAPYKNTKLYAAGDFSRHIGHHWRVKSTVTDPSAIVRDTPFFGANSQWETPYMVQVDWDSNTNFLAGDPRIILYYNATSKTYLQFKRTAAALTGSAPFINPTADNKTYYEPIGGGGGNNGYVQ